MSIFGGNAAKDLTAKIDRETDEEVLAEQEKVAETIGVERTEKVEELAERARAEAAKTERDELGDDSEHGSGWYGEVSAETRALGSAALEQAVIASNEAIKEQVAVENGYVDTGLEAGRNVIGGESNEQIKARIEDDLSDAQLEEKVDLPPALQGEAKLLSKNQESLTKEVVAALDQITRRGDTGPYQIERIIWKAKMKMLDTIGKEWGERN